MEIENVKVQIKNAMSQMNDTIEFLKNDLSKVRAGKATPSLLAGLTVNCYGTNTPINQVANINTSDHKTIAIQPWDKNLVKEIEKTLINSDLGMNPENNGDIIRLKIPELTEERRIELVKQVKNKGENAKISIRNERRHAIDVFKKMENDGLSKDLRHDAEGDIQNLTDEFIATIDRLVSEKEKEIMTI